MRLVVFGLSVSSSWGNGHATLWRGLIRALAAHGHEVIFYERDAPYHAAHRDCFALPNGRLRLYAQLSAVRDEAESALQACDVAMVTSYCPDALRATELVLSSNAPIKAFYDLDTPITLDRLAHGEHVEYLGPHGLRDFDVVLSATGGAALHELQRVLGAKRVAALYASVDPRLHAPAPKMVRYRADLSFLGSHAPEQQTLLQELFLSPASLLPRATFALGGVQYPEDFAWPPNIKVLRHVPLAEHAAFFCSARLSLNITRAPMAALGHCPSARLFEAAACGAALISDAWPGLDEFYTPDEELLVARDRHDVIAALERDDAELKRMAARARERTLAQHTTEFRALQLIDILVEAKSEPRDFERTSRGVVEV